MSKPYVLFHANCPDGFGAAYAAWKKFQDDAVYMPVKHGEPLPEIAEGAPVYIIDFAYDRETLIDLAQRHQVQVLDHHKTAQADLEGLEFATFDMNQSGAVLAWNYFHPETSLPLLLEYVQDEDLWNWALPQSKEVCTALQLYPMDFETWDQLEVETLKREGTVALRYKQSLIDRLLKRVEFHDIAGYSVPVVNTPLFASELGNQLCEAYPEAAFSASYSDFEGKRKWSLRSIGDFDVSEICRQFGGGGHRNASGFSTILNAKNVL